MPSWEMELKRLIKNSTRAAHRKKASQSTPKNTSQSTNPQKYKVQRKSMTIKTIKRVHRSNQAGRKKSTNQLILAILKKHNAKLKKKGYLSMRTSSFGTRGQ
jgi:hypothetical protein